MEESHSESILTSVQNGRALQLERGTLNVIRLTGTGGATNLPAGRQKMGYVKIPIKQLHNKNL